MGGYHTFSQFPPMGVSILRVAEARVGWLPEYLRIMTQMPHWVSVPQMGLWVVVLDVFVEPCTFEWSPQAWTRNLNSDHDGPQIPVLPPFSQGL